jgi:hypothetical protein
MASSVEAKVKMASTIDIGLPHTTALQMEKI